MRLSALPYTLFISCLLAILPPGALSAQSLYPTGGDDRVVLQCNIDMPRGYISGMCILVKDGDDVKGGVFNEFGVSAINFTYNEKKEKVKILSVIKMMDKWYIRRLLRKDLRHVMQGLRQGCPTYENQKYKILYKFNNFQQRPYDD